MLKTTTNIFLVSIIGFLSCSPAKKETDKPTPSAPFVMPQNELPNLMMVVDEQRTISVRDLVGDNVILILFQSDCDHCQAEGKQIRKNIKAFEKYTLYFISADAPTEMEKYAKSLGLNKIENIHFCRTDVQSIIDSFGPIQTPSVFIFSENGKLLKSFIGQTDIENIIKVL
jgi:peroxiredoxin